MNQNMKCMALVGVLLFAATVAAQEEQADLTRSYELEVKAGHEAEFEAALKQQMRWYEQNNETWSWQVWQWETGARTGEYVFRSPGHTWSDMDDRAERAAEARKNFQKVVGPHLDGMQSTISKTLMDVSHWPEDYGEVPMVSVHVFKLHYGMNEDFAYVMKKIHEAIAKTSWPVSYAWSAIVSGGEAGTFAIVVPHKSYADMKEPEKPFREMMEEALGHEEAEAVNEMLKACVREQHSALARFRPDLSYMPEQE